MLVLNGKEVSKTIKDSLIGRVNNVKAKLGFTPILATILVGDNPASVTYVNMKKKACEKIGLESKVINLDNNIEIEDLIRIINELNEDNKVCGILLQHPIPKHLDEKIAFNAICESKDVDGVTSLSFGKMSFGIKSFVPATPLGIMKLIDYYGIDISGLNAVVVGRSAILGKPIAMQLLNRNATVTICHSHTKNLKNIIKRADIVVGAVGKPKFIQADWVKRNAILIDAGYNEGNVGDIDLENACQKAKAYTPVPGGVGPMTIACLLTQCVESAENLANNL